MKMQAIQMLPVRHLPQVVAFYEKFGFNMVELRDEWDWASLSYADCRLMLDLAIMAGETDPRNSVVYLYSENIND